MKPRILSAARLSLPLATALAALLAAPAAHAAVFYWDTNSTTAGLGNVAGTWGTSAFRATYPIDATSAVLDGTAATVATATGTGDQIYFGTNNLALGSLASTIGIAGGGVSINSIVFGTGQASQGVALSDGGGIITLGGTTPTITANNTGANTIGAVLAGTVGLVKAGSGTLTLTGANSFIGGLTVAGGGTLQAGNGSTGSLTSQALTFNNGGGVFNAQSASAGSTQAMGALTFSTTGLGAGTVQSTYGTSGNAALTFTSLAARGAGATGNFVVSGGSNGTTNKITITGASTGTLLDKGLFFGGSSYAAYDTTGFVRAYGSGDTNYLAAPGGTTIGASTSTDNVELTAGNITAQTSASANTINLGANSIAMDAGGTDLILQANGLLSSGSGSATIGGGTTPRLQSTTSGGEMVIRVNGASDALNISSVIQNNTSASPLTKSGAGTMTLSGTNTYTGTTFINGGTLAVSGGSAIANTGAVVLANAAGATFQLSGSESIGQLSGGGFSGGNVNVGANTLTIANANNQTFGGTFSGTSAGGVTISSGTLTLSNKNSFAGTIALNGGTLALAYGYDGTANPAPLSSGGAISMANGTFLNLVNVASVNNGVGAQGLLNRNAAGGLVTSNAINITSGTATIQTTSASGANDLKWIFSENVTGGTSGAQTLAIAPGGATAPNGGDRTNMLFSGIIQNGGGGTLGVNVDFKGGTGTGQELHVNLSGQNTFSGPLVVNNTRGLVFAYNGPTGGNSGGYLAIGGETNRSFYTGRSVTVGSGYLAGGNYTNTISLATGTALNYISSANQTLGGVISGGGNLVMDRSAGAASVGTLTLSEANTFTGLTVVNNGILNLTNPLALQNSAINAVNSSTGSTTTGLKTNQTALTIGGLTGTASPKNLASLFTTSSGGYSGVTALTLNPQSGSSVTYSGIIANGESGMTLSKTGAGTQILSGANSYSGATTIHAGMLALGNGGSLTSTPSVTVNSTGTLGVRQTASSTTNSIAAPITLSSGSALNMGDGFTSQLNLTSASASSLSPASGVAPLLTFDIIGAAADQLNITDAATAGAAGAKINIATSTTPITPGLYTVIAGGASSALNTGFSLSNSVLPNAGGLYTLSLASSTTTAAIVTVTADANALYWKGSTTDLNAAGNWTTDQAGTTASGSIASINNLVFNATGAGNLTTSTLSAGLSVNSVTFLPGAAAVTIASTSANQLTIGSGGITNASANAMTINTPITLGAAQSWTNIGAGLLTMGEAVTNASNLLTIAGTGNTTISNVIGSGDGGLTKEDSGTLTLSGANTFTGAVTINAGTLSIPSVNTVANANPLGQSAATADSLILNGGTLRYSGAVASTDRLFSLQSSSTIDASGASNAALNFNNTGSMGFNGNTAAKTLTLTGTSTGQNTLAALIADNTGATSVTKTGTGTWVLSNSGNSYSGATTLNAGTLQYASKTAFGTSTLYLAGGTKLQKITEEANIVGNAMSNNIILSGGQVEMNVDFSNAKDQWFSGVISGTGSLRVTGSGSFARSIYLAGNNDFSGGVTLDTSTTQSAWIALVNANGLGTGTLTINHTGGAAAQGLGATTNLTTGSGVTNNIVINSSATLNLGGPSGTTGNMLLSGIISGAGSLNKSGAAVTTFTLGGANTYTGNTTVSTGTLVLADNAQLKFVLGATSGSNNSISGAGTVTLEGDFVIDTSAADALPSGTWTLENVSSLTGAYGTNFTVVGFTNAGSDKWTKVNGAKTYTFDETTGILTLAAGNTYATWIAGFPGVGLLNGVNDDPDNDGIDNGMEMVLGGNPATGMDTALLPTIELVNADPDGDTTFSDYLLFTYRRTAISEAALVAATCETDTDLVGPWSTAINGVSGVVIQEDINFTFTPPAPANTDRVRVYVPLGANTKLFGRLNVVVP